jgi:hypothetical protein
MYGRSEFLGVPVPVLLVLMMQEDEKAGGGPGYVTDMLQKLSRGDFLSTAHNGQFFFSAL